MVRSFFRFPLADVIHVQHLKLCTAQHRRPWHRSPVWARFPPWAGFLRSGGETFFQQSEQPELNTCTRWLSCTNAVIHAEIYRAVESLLQYMCCLQSYRKKMMIVLRLNMDICHGDAENSEATGLCKEKTFWKTFCLLASQRNKRWHSVLPCCAFFLRAVHLFLIEFQRLLFHQDVFVKKNSWWH